MVEVIKSCIGTKFMGQYGDLACSIALQAVKTITTQQDGRTEIDTKKWARIEKVSEGILNYHINVLVVHPWLSRDSFSDKFSPAFV